jgi:hypothetical protein
LVVKHFRERLPHVRDDLKGAYEALKTTRDKRAHNEDADRASWGTSTWSDAQAMVEYAIRFLGAAGMGYLAIAYTDDDGRYTLEFDARRTPAGLRRLLRAAGLIEPDLRGWD